jgi:site-specific DNA-methyltransferase (adenine-specific)
MIEIEIVDKIETDLYTLYCGDCLEIMPTLDMGVDAIITDIPYGTTYCAWDEIIPLAPMWTEARRLLKPRGAFVTTASQPFTSKLIMSNINFYKYCWYWYKNLVSGFQLAKIQPTRWIEEILVFYDEQCVYNKQPTESRIKDRKRIVGALNGSSGNHHHRDDHRFHLKAQKNIFSEFVSPRNVLEIPCVPRSKGTLHPAQKPVALYEYLIRTYTNPGETVLDICMGSGTTIIAALNTGRKAIGIEKDPHYFEIAAKRISDAAAQLRMNI